MKALLFALILMLPALAPAAELYTRAYPPVNGVQVFVLSPDYVSDPGVFFKELKSKGIDTVFFRVFHNSADRMHMGLENPCHDGGVYFATPYACTVADLLPEMIAYARENGIKIYAWMATRSLTFLKTPENLSESFDANARGNVPGYGANIFTPHVRDTLKGLFNSLAEYDLDGVLVQDDFVIKYSEGADRAACEKFTKDTGIECSLNTFFTEQNGRLIPVQDKHRIWSEWKAAELENLLRELRHGARLRNPDLMWAVNIYYETPIYPDRGLAWYAHDIDGLINAGADYLAVMAYHEQISSELRLTRDEMLAFMQNLASATLSHVQPSRAVFKLQVRLFDKNRTQVRDTDIKLVRLRIKRSGGESFVQLPVNNAEDILIK